MDALTSAEYWSEVESIAKQVTQEARDDDRDISDVLHETIDSHQWVIYNFYHLQILQHSSNEDAYFESCGEPINATDCSSLFQTLAFYALQADIQAHAEYDATPDEDEDEDESEGEVSSV